MKRLLLLIFVIVVFGCKSNKIFYEYEDVGTKTYAILEISEKGKQVDYLSVSNSYSNRFICLEGNKSRIYLDDIGVNYFLGMSIIDFEFNLTSCFDFDGGQALIYYQDEKENNKIIFKKSDKIKCLETHDITWFPPYMKKVDKIDYNKFPEEIRETVIAIDKNKSQEKIQEILQKQKNSN